MCASQKVRTSQALAILKSTTIQVISEINLDVLSNRIFVRIAVLASKVGQIKKNSLLYYIICHFLLSNMIVIWPILKARPEILSKMLLLFW